MTPEQIREIKQKHLKDDIYALTGATISSRAVTNGVKDTVRKFVYRLDILNDAHQTRKYPGCLLAEVECEQEFATSLERVHSRESDFPIWP